MNVPQITLSTDLAVIKEQVVQLEAAIKANQGELRVLRAMLSAVHSCCEHKNKTSYYDGGKCNDCGWTW